MLEPEMEKQRAAVPAPPAAIAQPLDPAPVSTTHVFKRRQKVSEEDLKKELRWAKEIPPMTSATTTQLMNRHMERFRSFGDIDFEPRVLLEVRPDLRALPVRHGSPIKLDARSAEALQVFSRRLHYLVDHTVPRKVDGEHVKPEWMRERMSKEVSPGHRPAWVRPEAVPALRQILMGEDKPLRWLLVELLAENPSPAASAALAQRAVFELSADLRQKAVEALQGRPPRDFRHVLLNGLHYPWPPAADHAAEALVALGDREAVPTLITYLKKPDPNQPFQTAQNHTLVREVVRIHHQTNCLMCHSPAVTGWKDPVAGQVPGVFLTGTIEGGGGGYHPTQFPRPTANPLLVRADIVFMRQDFSVPVSMGPAGGVLPVDQRFDFLVRTRPVKAQELSELKTAPATSSYPQREAVLWALRELTGQDAGHMTADWVRLFPRAELDVEAARLSSQLIQTRGVKLAQLLAKFKDHEGDAFTQALAEAIPQMKGKNQDQARRALAERLSRMNVDVLRDRLKDEDREIRRAAATASGLKASDDLVLDLFDLLEDTDSAVVEAAQSALQRLTGRDVAASG
jgi:HEAT repeat protein